MLSAVRRCSVTLSTTNDENGATVASLATRLTAPLSSLGKYAESPPLFFSSQKASLPLSSAPAQPITAAPPWPTPPPQISWLSKVVRAVVREPSIFSQSSKGAPSSAFDSSIFPPLASPEICPTRVYLLARRQQTKRASTFRRHATARPRLRYNRGRLSTSRWYPFSATQSRSREILCRCLNAFDFTICTAVVLYLWSTNELRSHSCEWSKLGTEMGGIIL